MSQQGMQLAGDLPRYQHVLAEKISALRTFDGIDEFVDRLLAVDDLAAAAQPKKGKKKTARPNIAI